MLIVSKTPRCQARSPRRSGRAGERQFGPDDSSLKQHLAPEPDQLGRTATGLRRNVTGILDQSLLVNQPTEILFVQPLAGERLDGALERKQREARRHQLEDDWAVLDLGPKARDAGRKNAAMVMLHGRTR